MEKHPDQYQLTIRIPVCACDDIMARQVTKEFLRVLHQQMGEKNVKTTWSKWMDNLRPKLQEIYDNKQPRSISLI